MPTNRPNQDLVDRNRSQLNRQKARYDNAMQRRDEQDSQTPLPAESAGYDDTGRLTTKRPGHNALPSKSVDTTGAIANGQPVVMRGNRSDAMPRVKQTTTATTTEDKKGEWAIGYANIDDPGDTTPRIPEGMRIYVDDNEIVAADMAIENPENMTVTLARITEWTKFNPPLTYKAVLQDFASRRGNLYLIIRSSDSNELNLSATLIATQVTTAVNTSTNPLNPGFYTYEATCNSDSLSLPNLPVLSGGAPSVDYTVGSQLTEFSTNINPTGTGLGADVQAQFRLLFSAGGVRANGELTWTFDG